MESPADSAAADDGAGDDDDGAGDVDDGAVADGDERVAARRRWVRPVRWAAAVAVVAVLTSAGYQSWLLFQRHQNDVAAAQALAAATKYAVALTSVDNNAIDKNFADVLDGSTGEFKDMYTKSSVQLRQLLVDNKATAHGTAVEAAIQSATKNRAVVLLFVDQSVSNLAVPTPRIDRSRIKMTMEKVDGRWLASKVELP